MFYISLPFFYENYKFNNFFKKYVNDSYHFKESKLVDNFNIEYAFGAFPWSIWNGGNNTHTGNAVLNTDIQSLLNNSLISLRIDASNINLQETDFYDIKENAVLKNINGLNHVYEISLLDLGTYISQYNLNNKFILSNNIQIYSDLNIENINVLCKESTIDLINIGYQTKLDLDDIDNKNKIEISIGHCGNCSKEQCLSCSFEEQKNIYNYSGISLYANCPKEKKNINYYEELLYYYKNFKIKHFKIITSINDLSNFNINIIKSFIKKEYWGECIDEYYKAISK